MTAIDRQTSRLIDLTLPSVYSLSDEAKAERANREALDQFKKSLDAESVFSRRGLEAAFWGSGPTAAIVNIIGRSGWEPDPNFQLTQDAYEKLAEGIDPDLWPRLATAVSFEHSVFLREQARRQTENRRLLSAYGWGGQALYTAGQFLDPAALGVGIASAGVATAVSAGTSASRVARLARAGFIGASGNAAVTALSGVDDPRIGAGDIALSAAAGAGFGVGVGATRLRGVVGRAVGAGVGQAAPGFAIDLAGTATGDKGVSDLLLNAAHNLASGGILGGLNFNVPRLSEAVTPEAAARVAKGSRQAGTELAFTLQEDMRNTASRMAKDALWEDLRNNGITLDDLTPEGRDYFRDQVNQRVSSPVIGLLDSMPPGDATPPPPTPPIVSATQTPGFPRAWQTTADAFKQTGRRLLHGTSRVFDRFESGTQSRFKGRKSLHVYMTDMPIVAENFSEGTGAFKQVSLEKWRLDEFGNSEYDALTERGSSASKQEIDAFVSEFYSELNAQISKGSRLYYIDHSVPAGEKSVKRRVARAEDVPFDDYLDGDVRLYRQEPRVIEADVYGGEIDLVNGPIPDWVPESIRKWGEKNYTWDHEFDASILPWMREHGVGKLRVSDNYESGGSSYIVDPEMVSYGRDVYAEQQAKAPPPSDSPRTEVPPRVNVPPRTNDVGLGAASPSAPGMGGGPPPKTNAKPGDLDLSGVNDAAWAMNARSTVGGRDVNIEGVPTRTRDETRVFGLPKQLSARFSMGSWVGGHVLSQFRRVANALFPDPMAKSDGSIVRNSAAEWATATRRRSDNRVSAALTEAYARHIEAAAASGSKPLGLDEFFDVADRAHRDPAHPMRSDPGVAHAITEAAAIYKEHLELMQRHGVFGADTVPFDADYTPVRWSRTALDAAVRKHGDTAVVNALAKAILADPKQRADPAMAWHLAGAIVKNGGMRGFDRSGAWTPEEVESVRSAVQSWVESSQPGLNPRQVQDLVDMVMAYASEQSAPAETGKPPRLRRRIPMDHAAVIDMPDGSRLPVSDLLINDIELQMRGYANQAVGASAIAEVFRTQGSGKATNIRDFVAELRQTAIDYSLKPQEYQSSLEHIETGLKLVAGLPLYDTHTATARSLRVIRDLNAARTLGSLAVGVQNFAELVPSLARNGFNAAVRTFFPALEAVRREAIRRNTGVARELALVGSVDDAFGGRWRGFGESAADRAMGKGKGERLAHAVADGAMRLSGLKPGQSFMQRWSTLSLMQRLGDMAVSSRPMSEQWRALLGWSDTEAAAILDQLRTHQRREGSTFDPNVDAWTDTAAQAAYREGVAWAVRRDILNPSAIDGPRWMTTPVGQIFGQLRRFSIGAWESKLLHGIQRRDKLVFMQFMGATVGAALTYMARRMVDAATKEDPGAYLEEQLAPDKIAAAAFSRSAYASLLPGFADSALNLTGRPAVFEFARGSGLKGNFWEGVPAIDWLSNVWRARQTIPGVLTNPDYHFSEDDLRAMTNAAFIPNVLGVRDILYRLAREAGIPSRSLSGSNP